MIRRELEVAEQELIFGGNIKRSQNALQRTGYFKNVELTTQKTNRQDEVDLIVEVQEGPTGSLSAGGGFSSGEGVVFSVSASEKNLFGRGQGLSAFFDIGSTRQDFIVNFSEPYLFNSRVSMGVSGFNKQTKFADFDSRRTGFSLNTGYPLKHLELPFFQREEPGLERQAGGFNRSPSFVQNMRVGLGYVLSFDEVTDLEEGVSEEIQDEEGTTANSIITPSLSYDTRDHFFIPTEGTRSTLSLDIAGLGGDNRFVKADSNMQWYYSLLNNPNWGGAYTLGLKSRMGYSVIFDRPNGGDNLPISQRYFMGGTNSVRGFEDRSLGPRDENGEVIGGDKLLSMTTELRFPVLNKLGLFGVAFFDQGQAFRASDAFDLGEFRRSIGMGARWMSPFGPLKVDFGFPINEKPDDETSVLNFSVGGRSF